MIVGDTFLDTSVLDNVTTSYAPTRFLYSIMWIAWLMYFLMAVVLVHQLILRVKVSITFCNISNITNIRYRLSPRRGRDSPVARNFFRNIGIVDKKM
jgi:hypothetical protein